MKQGAYKNVIESFKKYTSRDLGFTGKSGCKAEQCTELTYFYCWQGDGTEMESPGCRKSAAIQG
jgi:hypothetical protein